MKDELAELNNLFVLTLVRNGTDSLQIELKKLMYHSMSKHYKIVIPYSLTLFQDLLQAYVEVNLREAESLVGGAKMT